VPGEEFAKYFFERYVEMNAHAWSYLGYVLRQGFEKEEAAAESKKEKESHCNTPSCDLRSPFGPTKDVVPATDTDGWVTLFREADFEKNLTGNWVMDESEEYGRCGMAINHLIPVMDVRYTDDLTVDPTDDDSQDTSQDDCGPETCPHLFVSYLP
jgi:hypothetical protein